MFAEVCELKRFISESKVWKSRHYLTHVCTLTFPQQRHLHLLMWTNGHTNFLSTSLDAIRSRNVTATGLKRNGRRRSIRCGHISEQSVSGGCHANVWPVSTIIIIYIMIFTTSRKNALVQILQISYRSYMPCLGVLGTDWGCWRQRCKHWWPLRWARPPWLKPHLRTL